MTLSFTVGCDFTLNLHIYCWVWWPVHAFQSFRLRRDGHEALLYNKGQTFSISHGGSTFKLHPWSFITIPSYLFINLCAKLIYNNAKGDEQIAPLCSRHTSGTGAAPPHQSWSTVETQGWDIQVLSTIRQQQFVIISWLITFALTVTILP